MPQTTVRISISAKELENILFEHCKKHAPAGYIPDMATLIIHSEPRTGQMESIDIKCKPI